MRSFVNSRGRSFHMYHADHRPVVLTPGPTRHTPRSQGAMRSSLLLPLHFVTHGQPPTTAAPKLKVGALLARLLAERCGAPRPLGRLSRKPFKKSRFELSYPDGLFGCTKDGEDQAEADADLERRAWWRGHAGQATYVGWDQTHASMCNSTASSASRKAPPPPRCCAPSSSRALAYS